MHQPVGELCDGGGDNAAATTSAAAAAAVALVDASLADVTAGGCRRRRQDTADGRMHVAISEGEWEYFHALECWFLLR